MANAMEAAFPHVEMEPVSRRCSRSRRCCGRRLFPRTGGREDGRPASRGIGVAPTGGPALPPGGDSRAAAVGPAIAGASVSVGVSITAQTNAVPAAIGTAAAPAMTLFER
ncbi:hypothetical protein [Actinoallomurus iriomotensis]|uniref:Uncharacterized protein n=1 Tax=Actinoallomurus iriomotensis TaxID=478107 RepID=A0A9W6S3K9_9ACTN|nr:hypothetical protein [Actinoallomurus iriomotensis]GLY85137.1 hypothetical protein Airi02_030660 [Actinoallomurus iriomotensis]